MFNSQQKIQLIYDEEFKKNWNLVEGQSNKVIPEPNEASWRR